MRVSEHLLGHLDFGKTLSSLDTNYAYSNAALASSNSYQPNQTSVTARICASHYSNSSPRIAGKSRAG